MVTRCVWCGDDIEEVENQATMDTCEECEDYFEEHLDDIILTLNEMLLENENLKPEVAADKISCAWRSYSIITAIHMLSSKPKIEFRDSCFLRDLKNRKSI